MSKLDDDSIMMFGKHKGQPMSVVPASYLWYLWTNGMSGEQGDVANYIRDNLEVLKSEFTKEEWE